MTERKTHPSERGWDVSDTNLVEGCIDEWYLDLFHQ